MTSSRYPYAPSLPSEGVSGLVSVVVVYYRGVEDLKRCVASVWAQDWPDLELVVVDNASVDAAPFSLATLPQPEAAGRRRTLRRLRLADNDGFAAGANAGLALAKGEHILLLNPDAALAASFLGEAMAANADVVIPRVLLADDPERLDNCGHGLFPDGLNWCRGRGEKAAGRFEQDEELLFFSGAAVLLHRRVLAVVGGLDPSYFAYGEDADLSLRVARAGFRCRYLPSATVSHRVGGAFGQFSLRKVFYVERNRARVALTHLPASWLVTAPLWTALRHVLMAAAMTGGRGVASRAGSSQRWALPLAVAAAHLASVLDLPGSVGRRRALNGGLSAQVLRRARVGPVQFARTLLARDGM